MGRRVLRRHIWGYSVGLCPIKRTPGLYRLMSRKMGHTAVLAIKVTVTFINLKKGDRKNCTITTVDS